MSPAACPYCSKTYSTHARLLMHIELPPQKGNRNTEICLQLDAEDSPIQQWVKVLLKIKGNKRELRIRPKKLLYRMHPIIRMKLKTRQQQKEQREQKLETQTDVHTETRQQDQQKKQIPKTTTPKQKHQKGDTEEQNRDKQPKMEYLQCPTETTRARKRTTQERKIRPMAPKQTEEITQKRGAEHQGPNHQEHTPYCKSRTMPKNKWT